MCHFHFPRRAAFFFLTGISALILTGLFFPFPLGAIIHFKYPPGLDSPAVEAAASDISEAEMRRIMEKLTGEEFSGREFGTEYGRNAAEYIAAELQSYGYAPTLEEGTSFFQKIPSGASEGQNVLAVLPGSDPELAETFIILCAHYDHLGARKSPVTEAYGREGREEPGEFRMIYYPGADDNASSVAILLSVAKAMKRMPAAPKHSLLFLFTDGEEKGLLGARHWVANPTVPHENIQLVINLDMNGRLNQKSRLYIFAARTGTGLEAWCHAGNTAEEPLNLIFPWSVLPRADHAAFLQEEIPVLLVVAGFSPFYHTPRDTVETVRFPGMKRIAEYVLRTVVRMACAENVTEYREEWVREKCLVEDEMAGFFADAAEDNDSE